jgi:hypothetical protein
MSALATSRDPLKKLRLEYYQEALQEVGKVSHHKQVKKGRESQYNSAFLPSNSYTVSYTNSHTVSYTNSYTAFNSSRLGPQTVPIGLKTKSEPRGTIHKIKKSLE